MNTKTVHSLLLVLFLGSCTNARLIPQEPLSQQSVTTKGTYCSQYGRNGSAPLKVLFVVDMSMSNVGTFNSQGNFDSSTGTDTQGLRFQAIENFVKDCGGANTQYAVSAFSNDVVSSDGSQTCNIGFSNGTALSQTLQGLRGIQTYDSNFYATYKSGPLDTKVRMRETAYLKGLDCMKKIIQNDLAQNSSQHPYYHIFFLTDGRPTQDGTCNSNPNCYRDSIEPFVAQVTSSQSSIKLQPIYYGNVAAEKDQALTILNPMAQAGGVDQTLVVDQLKSTALCGTVAKPVSVRFRKELLLTINLNAKMVKGHLKSDSDADGIPDEDEAALGFDPGNPRTFGILDSICRTSGGPDACKKAMATLKCQGISNNLGLTDCDIAFLKLSDSDPSSDDKGIDSDGDGIPDFVEIVRDTVASVADANQDLDGDGWSNQLELAQGSQVNFPDHDVSDLLKVVAQETFLQDSPLCPAQSEAWSLDLRNLPTVTTTAAFTDSRTCVTGQESIRKCMKFSHSANENVILIVFKSIPENDPASQAEVWGATYRLTTAVGHAPPIIQPQDFFLLGRVHQ